MREYCSLFLGSTEQFRDNLLQFIKDIFDNLNKPPHESHKGLNTRRGMDPLAPDIYSAILSASKHCLN